MTSYRAPLKDIRFVLDDYLAIDRYANLPRFADAPAERVDRRYRHPPAPERRLAAAHAQACPPADVAQPDRPVAGDVASTGGLRRAEPVVSAFQRNLAS